MIGICLSAAWPQYYAASPFNNIISCEHGRFKHLEFTPWTDSFNQTLIDEINKCEAILVDDVTVDHLQFYTAGPKLNIGGDLHAHNAAGLTRREADFKGSDYVLSGGIFAPKHKNYLWPDDKYREKLVYLPNSTPDNRFLPELPKWEDRISKMVVAGSISDVYPYRKKAKKFADVMPPTPREEYFKYLARYKAGITCNSILIYTVAKYFEIPWVGSLLVAAEIQPIEQELLGFVSGHNCILTSQPELYKDDLELGSKHYIAINGESLIRKRHTASRRLDYISLIVDSIIKGNFKPDDALQIFKGLL